MIHTHAIQPSREEQTLFSCFASFIAQQRGTHRRRAPPPQWLGPMATSPPTITGVSRFVMAFVFTKRILSFIGQFHVCI